MLRIQDLLRRVTGHTVTVRLEVDRSANAAANGVASVAAPTDRKKSLASLPLFKKASDTLGAQIWHVDDDFNPLAPPPQPSSEPAATDTDEE